MVRPNRPISRMPATMSAGYSSACSSAWACGMISLSTNCLTVARISCCTSVSPAVWARRGMFWVSLLDDAAVVQAGQLGGGEVEDLGENLVSVAAEDRALPRLTVGAVPAQRGARGDRGDRGDRCACLGGRVGVFLVRVFLILVFWVSELEVGQDRVGAVAMGGGGLGHARVGAPQRPRAGEIGPGPAEVTAGEPGAEDRRDRLPGPG